MPTLKAASKKVTQQNKVQQLDNFGTDISQFIQEEAFSVIENVLGDFVLRVQDNINKEKDFVVTGKISDISIKEENGVINVYANRYLIYQDRGVNGSKSKLYNTPFSYTTKMPPMSVFKDWIKQKGITLKKVEGLSDDEIATKAAWGMAKNVFNYGFKPRNVYTKEIPKLIEDLQQEILGFTGEVIAQAL